jgi:hypothetical protein
VCIVAFGSSFDCIAFLGPRLIVHLFHKTVSVLMLCIRPSLSVSRETKRVREELRLKNRGFCLLSVDSPLIFRAPLSEKSYQFVTTKLFVELWVRCCCCVRSCAAS